MALLYEKVVSIVCKSPEERTDTEIEQILPWFRKKSDLFKSQKTEIVKDIVKNCEFTICKRDTVIIKQGDKGDCFFIILNGSVAIHIQTNFTEDSPPIHDDRPYDDTGDDRKPKELDRSKFGNFVGKIPAGKSFGELALINTDCVRNATIIADEVTDLLVVNRDLYNRSLKAFQLKEFEEKKRFVEEYPLFQGWQHRYKKQMAMSLRKEKINFDGIIIKQGCPLDGICFLLSGQAKMLVDPVQHEIQYPELFPLTDIAELEKVEARESIRREMNMAFQKVEEKKPTFHRTRSPHLERKRAHRNIEVCVMGAVELIGDFEMTTGLSSYAETVQCSQETEVFILDQKNYERLIEKRNPQSIDLMRDAFREKLKLRLSWMQDKELPLLRYFLYKLEERKRHENDKFNEKKKNYKDSLLDWKLESLQRGPLIDLRGPGSIFHTIRMREKTRKGPSVFSSRGGASGFGITRHLVLSKGAHGTNMHMYNMSIPNTSVNVQHAYNEDAQRHDENEAISVNGEITDADMVDSPTQFRGRFLCDTGGRNTNTNSSLGTPDRRVDSWARNFEISENALAMLEERIEEWHRKLGENKKGAKHTVKLHRYTVDEHNKPLPGKRIVLKPRSPAKPSLLSIQIGAAGSSPEVVTAANLACAGFPTEVPSNLYSESQVDTVNPIGSHGGYKRPQSSRSSFSQGIFHLHRRPRSARRYTAEDYSVLKEELRRKQRAYKSILTRTTTCVM